ncbi:YihY/virulence factor BrkB family protein [Streptomyces sodiiphilus]|uniref:YihY/virulence factor BrkB family protein n=1 Tax=Streptomyces sodiiphilus TaxID=226217 RepID=UPI0031DE11B8
MPAPPPAQWRRALRRTPVALWRDDVDHWAAALTYYSVLAVFPALLVAVSVIGLAFPSAARDLIDQVTAVVPAGSRGDLRSVLREMADQSSAAWLLIGVGTASALVSSYSYLTVFRRVLHLMHDIPDRRPARRAVPRTALTALGLLLLLVTSAAVLVLTEEAVRAIGRLLDIAGLAVAAWNAAKWPLLLALVTGLVLILFRTGPPQARRVWRGAPGGALAVVLWLVASAGFALYASQVTTYNRLYGSLAGIIVFLVWLWVSNLALLAGAQFNTELVRPPLRPSSPPGR